MKRRSFLKLILLAALPRFSFGNDRVSTVEEYKKNKITYINGWSYSETELNVSRRRN